MIYLDNSSTTPVDKRVIKAMQKYLAEDYGNPSSIHTMGRTARQAVDNARKQIAEVLNCKPTEIVFTSGGTESVNLAIKGLGKRTLCSEIEHHAVLDCAEETIRVNEDGFVDLEQLEKRLKKGGIGLVSVMYANNEIGTIQPIKEISAICHKFDVLLHTDACQATPYLDMDVKKLGVDLMTINGSKVYGPKGIGALYVKEGVKLEPIVHGGGQEGGLRSGTENVPGIVGLGEALEIAAKTRTAESKRLSKMRDDLIAKLLEIDDTVLNGDKESRLPNNINVSFLGVEGESVLLKLDEAGFMVSTGSACSSASLEPSHVLLAIHKNKSEKYELAHGSLRISLGRHTTTKDVNDFAQTTKTVIAELRDISSIRTNE